MRISLNQNASSIYIYIYRERERERERVLTFFMWENMYRNGERMTYL